MIFGSPTSSETPAGRIPFSRPKAAGYYTPGIPKTGFYSHIHPFMHSMLPMTGYQPNIGPMPSDMVPGMVRVRNPRQTGIRQQLPSVVSQPMVTPQAQQVEAQPGGMAGFGFAGFSGGSRNGPSPYAVMRNGRIPGIRSAGTNIRTDVTNAPRWIKSLTSGAYPNANVPGGGY